MYKELRQLREEEGVFLGKTHLYNAHQLGRQ